jgi:hypothetical protein
MANNVHTVLRENPALQRMPQSQAEWRNFANELVKWVVDLDVQGQFTSEKPLPPVILANTGSIQTTDPITATDAGTSVTISVATHTVQRTSGPITYESGSITALSYDTTYYVYCDDNRYQGGTVPFFATTNRADVVGTIGRYYVGEVTTPIQAATATYGGPGAGGALYVSPAFRAARRGNYDREGGVSLANISTVNTGTDTSTAVTPESLAGSDLQASVTSIENNVVNSNPVYTRSNDNIDRDWDANAAATQITAPYIMSAEAAQIRDAVLELSDVVATIVRDLQSKGVLG